MAAANLSYRLLLAGDELVDHPLTAEALDACPVLLIPERGEFLPADRQLIENHTADRHVCASASEVLRTVKPVVQTNADVVRALPRVAPDSAVVHLLNYTYDTTRDDVRQLTDVQVQLDLQALGVPHAATCKFLAPHAEPQSLPVEHGAVVVPTLGLWGLLAF